MAVATAKRKAGPDGICTPWKSPSTDELCDVRPSWISKQTTPEVLEPVATLEQRLRFVSSPREAPAHGANTAVAPSPQTTLPQRAHNVQPQTAGVQLQKQSDSAPAEAPTDQWRLWLKPDSLNNIHTMEEDGWCMVDEYSKADISGQSPSPPSERAFDPSSDTIAPSEDSPVLFRRDTVRYFQWCVQNLPYHRSVFQLSIDVAQHQIVIHTSNKKYYKRIDVPEVVALGLQLQPELLAWEHDQGTLVVSYAKPTAAFFNESGRS